MIFGLVTLCSVKAAKKEKRTSVYSILSTMAWTIQMCNSKQHLEIMAESVCVSIVKYTNRGSVRLTVIHLHCYFLCLIVHLCVLLNVSAEHFNPVSTLSQCLVVDRDWLQVYIEYPQMTSAIVFALYRFVCHNVDFTTETKWLKAIVIWLSFLKGQLFVNLWI